ncbi:MAG: sulfite exporter TauE/SafE family protein [Bacteroidales bacterium]|nr:sulfite exporter TauE/SafE family protein [Bacteroidales bacterium]
MNDLYTALTIGLIGSIHCIGMCGPIAVALPVGNRSTTGKFVGVILYNLGRSVTYGVLGALFGLLGKGIEMAGFQQWASIILGVVMILSVLFPFLFHGKISVDQLLSGYAARLISNFRKLFGKTSYKNLAVIGLLNGLLPCGLVYVAVAGAINTNSVANGIAFMFVFGLGTIPVMMSVTMLGSIIGLRFRKQLNKVIPVFIVALGILFILRGLSLGIPFISPKSQMLTPEKEIKVEGSCCSPKKSVDYKME